MSDRSSSSRQMMLPGLDSDTSSLESAAGPAPSDSPASPTTPTSGPRRARVSLSRRPAGSEASATSATSGPSCSSSFEPAVLRSSWVSRLVADSVSSGSTLFALTLKARATPSGRQIPALRASVHRTSDSGSTSWPTPRATDGTRGSTSEKHKETGHDLPTIAGRSGWATPTVTQAGGTAEQFLERKRKLGGRCGVALTDLGLQARTFTRGARPNGFPAPTASKGRLNPEFVCWLMGYPPEWDATAPSGSRATATPSSRSKPRRSSEPR